MRHDSRHLAASIACISLACAALVASTPVVAGAQTPAEDSIAAFSEDADRVLSTAFDALEVVPGMAVAVVRGDRTVYARGFGTADLEAGIGAMAQYLSR